MITLILSSVFGGLLGAWLVRLVCDRYLEYKTSNTIEKISAHIAKNLSNNITNGSMLINERHDFRMHLEQIHKHNFSIHANSKPTPYNVIFSVGKSTSEAIEFMKTKSAKIENIYLNCDKDNINKVIGMGLSIKIQYEFLDNRESTSYFYNPPRNFNYCKKKMMAEFYKIKDKYPEYKFTISDRTVRTKDKEICNLM